MPDTKQGNNYENQNQNIAFMALTISFTCMITKLQNVQCRFELQLDENRERVDSHLFILLI